MKTYAVGDIHGCGNTFAALLEKLSLSKDDQLILLGDYINKGPRSREVLDSIMLLQSKGYKVIPLRGNHDHKLIDEVKGNVAARWATDPNLVCTVKSFGAKNPFEIDRKYLDFLNSTQFYFEGENFYFVHAGFNFHTRDPFLDKPAMLNIKRYPVDRRKLKGKRIIFGHIPRTINQLREELQEMPDRIGLDTGCVYYKTEGMGVLAALEVNSGTLVLQENVDQPYEGGEYKKGNK